MSEPSKAKVGDKCWIWNINSRVYGPDRKLTSRGHFREAVITGETRTSWFVGADKFRKDTGWNRSSQRYSQSRLFLTEQEVDDHCLREDHAYEISRAVLYLDAATLRMVARTIGYFFEEPKR